MKLLPAIVGLVIYLTVLTAAVAQDASGERLVSYHLRWQVGTSRAQQPAWNENAAGTSTGVVRFVAVHPRQPVAAVVFESSTDVHIINTLDGSTQQVLRTHARVAPSDLSDIAWNMENRTLTVAFDPILEIWNLDHRPPVITTVAENGRAPDVTWVPGDRRLSVAWGNDDQRALLLIEPETGEVLERTQIDGLMQQRWHPNGQHLAVYRYVDPSGQEETPIITSLLQVLDGEILAKTDTLVFDTMTPRPSFDWLPNGIELLGIACHEAVDGCAFWRWQPGLQTVTYVDSHLPEGTLGSSPIAIDAAGSRVAIGAAGLPQVFILRPDTLDLLLTIDDLAMPPSFVAWDNHDTLYVSDGTLKAFEIR